MKNRIFYIALSVFVGIISFPLISSTTLSCIPSSSIFDITHKDTISIANQNDFLYSFHFLIQQQPFLSFKYKWIKEFPDSVLAVGDISGDKRIQLLNGDIYSTVITEPLSYESINVRMGEVKDSALAFSSLLENYSIHNFILTHIESTNKYLSHGLLAETLSLSIGVSIFYSLQRIFDKEQEFIMWNQGTMGSGLATYITFHKETIPLGEKYSLDYSFTTTYSTPFEQTGSSGMIQSVKIKEGSRKYLSYLFIFFPFGSYGWNENTDQKRTQFSEISYEYQIPNLSIKYKHTLEFFEQSIFAYKGIPAKRVYFFEIENQGIGFSMKTTENHDENLEQEVEQTFSLTYTYLDLFLKGICTIVDGKLSYKGEIRLKKEPFLLTISINNEGNISYSLRMDSLHLPFELFFTFNSTNSIKLSFTIDQ